MIHRALAAIVFLGASGFACLAADAPPAFSALFGTWTVKRVVGSAYVSGGKTSERAPLGTRVAISANLIQTEEKYGDCKPRNPTIVEVDTEATLESVFQTKKEWLDLPRSAFKPRLPFLDAGCAYGLILDRDTLLWPFEGGYIYTLKRRRR